MSRPPLPTRTASLPAAEMPEVTGKVRQLRPFEAPRSLAVALVPVVDSIRQLNTRFGIRPYRVSLVHTLWSGERRGIGIPDVYRIEILPTPRVVDLGATPEILRSTGLTEEGSLSIDQISPKYSEDDLMGRNFDQQIPGLLRTNKSNSEFYWEVVEIRATIPVPIRRRYQPQAVPSLSRDGFQWSVLLIKQDYDTSRVEGVTIPRHTF